MIALVTVLLFALWNGLTIRWKLTGKGSPAWHAAGWVIRAVPIIGLWPDWLLMLLYVNLAWTVYDVIINLVNGWPVFFIGSTSWIDRNLGKWLYICKGLILILTIIVLLL